MIGKLKTWAKRVFARINRRRSALDEAEEKLLLGAVALSEKPLLALTMFYDALALAPKDKKTLKALGTIIPLAAKRAWDYAPWELKKTIDVPALGQVLLAKLQLQDNPAILAYFNGDRPGQHAVSVLTQYTSVEYRDAYFDGEKYDDLIKTLRESQEVRPCLP